MKQGTRDNVIYLAVGLVVLTFVVLDFFYADSHGRQMWWPSNFAYRLVGYLIIVEYFVVTETRKVGATLSQIVTCLVAAGILQVGVAFSFRHTLSARYSLTLWGLWVLEAFAIVQLMAWFVKLLRSRPDGN